MRAILTALVNLAQTTGRFTLAQATAIYNMLWMTFAFVLFACFAAFLLNAGLGWKAPSLVLAIVFAIAAVFLWAKPLHILIVAGAGLAKKITTSASLATEVEEALKVYLGFLKWVLLVGVTFLFITGTISFKHNPGAILPLLGALGVIGLFTWMWPQLFIGTMGRKLVYGYAVLVVVMSFATLFAPTLVKYTGWDPRAIGATKTEGSLYQLERVRRETADKNRAKELERITDKISNQETLTPAEERFVAEAQRSQNKNPATAQATAQVNVLTMQPGGKSERIPVPFQMRVKIDGKDYRHHCVYADGHEESFVQGERPCSSGDMPFVYATNLRTKDPNVITYSYVK